MPTHDSLGMTRSGCSHSQQRLDDSDIPEIRVKTAYNGQVFITYIDHKITYPMLMTEMKDICGFAQDQVKISISQVWDNNLKSTSISVLNPGLDGEVGG